MRKFLFVLLITLLAAFTGCRSDEFSDAAVSSASDTAKTISEASTMNTGRDESISSEDPSSSDTGDTFSAPSSDVAEDSSSASQPDDAMAATSQKPTAPAEQKPTAAPEQTNPPESASGSSSSASASSTPSITPPSEEKPTTPELPVSDQPEPTTSQPTETASQPERDMETEYARIIREAVAYAESYAAKGFTFVWDDSLEFSWESGAGWMGTPRVKYEGVDGTIEMLKYHIDKIVKTSTDPGNGVPAHSAHYKVMQVMVDGDTAFVVLYG